jgi:tetratricopeptide (TPR) repeat protein
METRGQRRAAAILRDLARLPLGTSKERLSLLTALRKRNLIAADEAVQFWDGQLLREVQVGGTEIYRDPVPSDLPDDLAALLDESAVLQRDGQLDRAEACLDTLLDRVPNHPVALGNLAGIRASQRRNQEPLEILRRLTAVHPDYLFARCNLASILIEEGALDEAQELLAGLGQRPRLHIQEAFALYGVTAMLHRARGEDAAADALIASLEKMTEDEHDKRMLATAKRRCERATAEGRVLGALRKAVGSLPQSSRPKGA